MFRRYFALPNNRSQEIIVELVKLFCEKTVTYNLNMFHSAVDFTQTKK